MSTTPRPLRSPWLGEGLTSATRDESGRKSGANMTIYGFAGRELVGRRGSRQTVMCRNDDARQARGFGAVASAFAESAALLHAGPHPGRSRGGRGPRYERPGWVKKAAGGPAVVRRPARLA